MALDVMIVDDSAAIRKILQRMLRQSGVAIGEVWEAADGFEALEVLKQSRVGLVLSDLNMPNMDGLQLLGEIRSNREWRHVPVIIITTEGGENKVMEAVHRGASGYVRKPFTSEQIKQKLMAVLSS
ncbi:MAG: response regulator [Bryobacteraceae bacterium]